MSRSRGCCSPLGARPHFLPAALAASPSGARERRRTEASVHCPRPRARAVVASQPAARPSTASCRFGSTSASSRRRGTRCRWRSTVLRPRVGGRHVFWARIKRVLPAGSRRLLGRRREPALVVARRLRQPTPSHVAEEPASTARTCSLRAGGRSASAASARSPPRASTTAARRHRSSPPTSASDAADDGYPCPSACSSVEERRPSKPLVGGSNPPRRMSAGRDRG